MQLHQYNVLLIVCKISFLAITSGRCAVAQDAAATATATGGVNNIPDNSNATVSVNNNNDNSNQKAPAGQQAARQSPAPAKCNTNYFKITGQVYSLQHDDPVALKQSLMQSRILVNYGQYIGYPREDGTFEVDTLPPGDSYIVEISHPRYIYDPYRVDITSKGKIRARQVNHIQPSLVQTVEYPLKFRPRSLHNYFIPRETWRIMDLLFNPMVIMMVVPLIIIWLLPKMMSPQEMQSQAGEMQMPEYNVPELSEMMASMFGGGAASSQASASQGGGGANSGGSGGSGSAGGGGGGGGGGRRRAGNHR